MSFGNVVNKFHDKHSFSHPSTTEQSNLSSPLVWSQKINNLNSSNKNLLLSSLINKGRCLSVNGQVVIGLDFSLLINCLSNDIHDTTKCSPSNRNGDWRSSVQHSLTSDQTLSTIHSNSPNHILTQMLSHLKDQPRLIVEHLKSGQNGGQTLFEPHINDGSDHLANLSDRTFSGELVDDLPAGNISSLRRRRRGQGFCSSRCGVVDSAVEEVAIRRGTVVSYRLR
uniref:Uncharacterized protein n=1 Tax=Opuntia streptacantha TaxID=393608 RepID=A0A7C9ABH6_OPUST